MATRTPTRRPDQKQITFLLHVKLWEKLQQAAETRSTPARDVTVSDILRELIDQHLDSRC